MEKLQYRRLGETLYHTVLENGLHIYVDPRPEFQKTFPYFITNYGSMDTRFRLEGVWHDTPAGVAHYLEHKTIEPAMRELTANGAAVNASTSLNRTDYYFECTEGFEENLRLMLACVANPGYTQKSVDKEQGIIGQEIRMGDDDPYTQIFYGMMEALYLYSPVRADIAGTVESISHITAETLDLCHRAFYDPGSMVLCVAGRADPERVAAIAREVLPRTGHPQAERDYGLPEPSQVAKSLWEKEMTVATPIFRVGMKDTPPERGEARLRWEIVGDLACEALLGTSSPLYDRLYHEGLIDEGFGYGCETYPGVAFFCAGGEGKDPAAVRDAILLEAERIGREGLEEEYFQRLKRAAYGNMVKALNSVDEVCRRVAMGHFDGYEYLRFPEVFDTIDKTDVEECIRRVAVKEKTALAVIRPKEETQ